jgi:hypothetical protein
LLRLYDYPIDEGVVGLLLVSGSVDVLVEEEEGNGVRNEENVPGVFSADLKHQLTGAAEAVYFPSTTPRRWAELLPTAHAKLPNSSSPPFIINAAAWMLLNHACL